MVYRTDEFLVLILFLIGFMPLLATIEASKAAATPEAITDHCGMLTITVDPRLELLAVIQYLCGSKMVFKTCPYAEAIEVWFGEYKDHPIIPRLRDMEECAYTQLKALRP